MRLTFGSCHCKVIISWYCLPIYGFGVLVFLYLYIRHVDYLCVFCHTYCHGVKLIVMEWSFLFGYLLVGLQFNIGKHEVLVRMKSPLLPVCFQDCKNYWSPMEESSLFLYQEMSEQPIKRSGNCVDNDSVFCMVVCTSFFLTLKAQGLDFSCCFGG